MTDPNAIAAHQAAVIKSAKVRASAERRPIFASFAVTGRCVKLDHYRPGSSLCRVAEVSPAGAVRWFPMGY